MPKVGSKHFSYSAKGKKAASAYAKRTGKRYGKPAAASPARAASAVHTNASFNYKSYIGMVIWFH